jgi:hypothetical protein
MPRSTTITDTHSRNPAERQPFPDERLMSPWIYLTDMAPQATVMNLDTGELRQVMSSSVKDKAPAGLRRYLLEENSGGVFRETGEVLPLSLELLDDMEDAYRAPNSWNYDWPHLQIEQEADADASRAALIHERLTRTMADHPYEFVITGLQRRYLMYFSDGNYNSQRRFERLIPSPIQPPYRRSGGLRRKYDWIWNSVMRDAGVPFPNDQKSLIGDSLRPCLYTGPAWVVRFTLDGRDVLMDRCRVYVDDDANFICSDWCQRHDYSSYNDGINLQQGIYTFDGWVTGPCVLKNTENGWKPKNVTFKRDAVRELMKKAPPVVPQFDETFAKASAAVKKYSKAHTPVVPTVDAGPITSDALAEALAVSQQIWDQKDASVTAATEKKGEVAKYGNWRLHLVPTDRDDKLFQCGWGYVMAFNDKDYETEDGNAFVAVRRLADGHLDTLTINDPHTYDWGFATVDVEGFMLVDGGDTLYVDSFLKMEPLEHGWYMWSAAQYYEHHLRLSDVAAVLLEA